MIVSARILLTGVAPLWLPWNVGLLVLECPPLADGGSLINGHAHEAVGPSTAVAIAQIKPHSSLAMAVVTTALILPLAQRRR